MRTQILFAILLSASPGAFAQLTKEDLDREIKPLIETVNRLQSQNSKLRSDIGTLNSKLSSANNSIDSLRTQTEVNSKAINQASQDLGSKITTSETNANQKISAVDESLSKKSLYGIIAVLSAVLITGLLYWLLSKRQITDKTEVIEQLNNTKSSIEESLVKEFGKQTDLIDSQLLLLAQQKKQVAISANVEPDHSLALKVADQITTIERAISLMDEKTKGLQRIKNSVTNLKDNLAANGYEIVEMVGKQFNQGMNIIVASSIPDENLKQGEEMITKIIKPQVNHNDKMVQAAQVEVSVGI